MIQSIPINSLMYTNICLGITQGEGGRMNEGWSGIILFCHQFIALIGQTGVIIINREKPFWIKKIDIYNRISVKNRQQCLIVDLNSNHLTCV